MKKSYWQDACQDYAKRIRPFHNLQLIEVEDERDPKDLSPANISKLLAKEAERIQKHLPTNSYIISLAITGKSYTSEAFANHISDLALAQHSRLTFIIGGSYGLDKSILAQSREELSFSKFTFPHQLMRIIFLEQLFRAAKISAGQTYHK